MATLFNTKISDTYVGLLKTIDNAVITASLKELTDGSGNQSGLYLNTAGDFKVTSILEWGSLKDTGTGVTITQFVTASNGIQNFNNDTTVPTSAAVKLYVDTKFATTDTLAEVLVFGNTTSGRDIVVSANDDITFTDSSKAKFGASGDLEIYHDGSNSYIADVGTGDLTIRSSNDLRLQAASTEAYLTCNENGSVQIYYNNTEKFATSSAGATVLGNLTVTGTITGVGGSYLPLAGGTMTGNTIHNDGVKSFYGTGSDLQIYHDGSNSYVSDVGTGDLRLSANNLRMQNADNSANYIKANNGSNVELYYNNSKKFETSNTGVTVTGDIAMNNNTGIQIKDNGGSKRDIIKFASNNQIQIGSSAIGGNIRFLNTGNYTFENGNVGIGTTAPTDKLHIFGTTAAVKIEGNGVTSANLKFKTNDTDRWNVNVPSGSTDLRFTTGSSDTLTLKSTGNVGIGTASPSSKLEVAGAGNQRLTVNRTDGDNFYIEAQNGQIRLRGSDPIYMGVNADLLSLTSTNVGIGTTSPSEKLEVDGNVKLTDFSDNILFGGTGNSLSYNQWLSSAGGGMVIKNVASASTGHIAFDTSTGEKVRITRDGNVGIGTTSPTRPLSVNGIQNWSFSGTEKAYLNPTSTGTDFALIGSNGNIRFDGRPSGNSYVGTGNFGIGTTAPSEKLEVVGNVKGSDFYGNLFSVGNEGKVVSTSTLGLQLQATASSKPITFFTNVGGTTEKLRIDPNGNVGIGTSSPYSKLTIIPSSNPTTPTEANQLSIGESSSNSGYNLRVGYFLEGGAYKGSIQSISGNTPNTLVLNGDGGNVGIGTTSPSSKLEVNGTATVNGQLNINGDATSSIRIGTGGTNAALIYSLTGDTLSIGANNATNFVCKTNKDVEFRGNVDLISNGALLLDNSNNNNQMYIRNGGSNAAAIQFGHGTVGGNILMSLASDGKLGVGTTSPSAKLQVSNSGSNADILVKNTSGNDAKILLEETSGSTQNGSIVFNQGGNNTLTIATGYQSSGDLNRINLAPAGNVGLTVRGGTGSNNGNVGIGTTTPTALLDVSSTTKGVLLPRMTTTQVNAISSPANGLTVYNTTLNTLCFYNGTSWQKVTSANM